MPARHPALPLSPHLTQPFLPTLPRSDLHRQPGPHRQGVAPARPCAGPDAQGAQARHLGGGLLAGGQGSGHGFRWGPPAACQGAWLPVCWPARRQPAGQAACPRLVFWAAEAPASCASFVAESNLLLTLRQQCVDSVRAPPQATRRCACGAWPMAPACAPLRGTRPRCCASTSSPPAPSCCLPGRTACSSCGACGYRVGSSRALPVPCAAGLPASWLRFHSNPTHLISHCVKVAAHACMPPLSQALATHLFPQSKAPWIHPCAGRSAR